MKKVAKSPNNRDLRRRTVDGESVRITANIATIIQIQSTRTAKLIAGT